MVRRRSKTKISASKLSTKDDLPAETTTTETDVPKPVMVDTPENITVSQSEYEMQTTLEQVESENLAIVVVNIEAKENKVDAAEEVIMAEQAAEGIGGGEVREEVYFDNDVNVGDEDNYGDDDVNVGDEDNYGDDDANVGNEDNYGDDDDIYDENDFDDEENDYDDDDDDNDDYGEDEDMMGEEDDSNDDHVDGDDTDDDYGEEELAEYAKEETKDKAAQKDEDYRENTAKGELKKETLKEENEEKGGRSLKRKDMPLRKGSESKKVKKGSLNEVTSKGEDNQEKGQDDAIEEEDVLEEIENKGEGSSMQKVKKLRNRSRKEKVTAEGSAKVAIKQDEKPESQREKKFSKKVASMGMIFMCSSKTKGDCYRYKVLGLPSGKRDIVEKIYKGMRLFLYDVDLKLMYGIYKAAGRGGYNIQPKAFNSQFPSQVRFTVLEDCLPVAEEKFKKVIKDNYFTKTKFDCQLTSKQVKNLCKLFLASSQGPKSRKLARGLRAHKHTSADRDRSRPTQGKQRKSAVEESRYNEYSRRLERAVDLQLPPLPPQATGPSYLYDRTLEMDAFRKDLSVMHHDRHREPVLEPRDAYRLGPVLEHRDVYRQEPLSSHRDSYRRDVVVEHRGLLSLDESRRYDPYISYREQPQRHDHQSRDEIARYDPYISYREPAAYRDRLYTRSALTENNHYRPRARSPEYRSAVVPGQEYHSARPLYRY